MESVETGSPFRAGQSETGCSGMNTVLGMERLHTYREKFKASAFIVNLDSIRANLHRYLVKWPPFSITNSSGFLKMVL